MKQTHTNISFPTLATPRLLLRRLIPADAEAIFAIKSDLDVTRQYGQEPHHTLADSLNWIQHLQVSFEERDSLFWGLTRRDDTYSSWGSGWRGHYASGCFSAGVTRTSCILAYSAWSGIH